MALLSVRHASFGYERKKVVEKVDFSVNAGDYLCIVGENGSGKSTLMKTILGLMPVIEGKILFGDGLKPNEIGYLPQQTEVQKDFPASVQEVVLSGCLNRMGLRPFYSAKEKQMAAYNMQRLAIENLSRQCYRELSGGQQQRVLLARALCATQKMLLLDEPVAGLDPNSTAEMYQIIHDLNQKDNVAVVMISHDIAAAIQYASHILHVSNTPLFYGEKQNYLQSNIGQLFGRKERGEA